MLCQLAFEMLVYVLFIVNCLWSDSKDKGEEVHEVTRTMTMTTIRSK